MERFIYPEVLDAIINVRKMLLIDIKNSKNLIPSEKVKVGSHQCSQTTTVQDLDIRELKRNIRTFLIILT